MLHRGHCIKILHSICIHVLTLFLYSTFCELCGFFFAQAPTKTVPQTSCRLFFLVYGCTTILFFCTVLFVSCVEYFSPKPPPKLSPKPQTMSCCLLNDIFFGVLGVVIVLYVSYYFLCLFLTKLP
jgi:hypothetical protein